MFAGVFPDRYFPTRYFPNIGEGEGVVDNESLGPGDLTTEWSLWLDGVLYPHNETMRTRLNAEYSTDYEDVQPLVSRFLDERT